MSIRNLKFLFEPRSVALIGASDRAGTVGAALARNLLSGGFRGDIMLVNPKHAELFNRRVWPDVHSLPAVPELAVIATPPQTVPELIAGLAARGTKAAIVITAGFAEVDREAGLRLQQSMLDAARPHLLRIMGPNCFGIVVPGHGLNTSFGRVMSAAGRIALASQSGAINAAVSDWAAARNIGFSHLISLGGMADVDFGDVLDYLANDASVAAILLYIEAITHPRKFMSAARAASRNKPVIVVKAGRSAGGAKAAASHTGALTGADDVYDAAFRRAGMLRVERLDHLFEAVETLSRLPRPAGGRLAIISNGGGLGVLAADATSAEHVELASLSSTVIEKLNSALPATWSKHNPVDIIGDATVERYVSALEAVVEDPAVDAVLVIHCPTAIQSSTEIADAVTARIRAGLRVPVLASWTGGPSVVEGRDRLSGGGVANFDTPEEAVRAFSQVVTFWRNQEQLLETPPAAPGEIHADPAAARLLIQTALTSGREWLDASESLDLLRAYDIPAAEAAKCADAEAAAAAAERIGGRVALKILSRDILHKSDVGGVVLGLDGAAKVRSAATAMMERLQRMQPKPRIDGLLIQSMVERPNAHSLLVGMTSDPTFGPVIVFGHGGTAVEVIADKAIGLPPLNMKLAREMMERTRIIRLLKGYRHKPAADCDAIAFTMLKISQMIVDHPEISELDINPLFADQNGILAVDARIRIAAAKQPADGRLAIKPYPAELEETVVLPSARRVLLRPVVPEDAAALTKLIDGLELRVAGQNLATHGALSSLRAPRSTQIDYDRQMVFVALNPVGPAIMKGVVGIDADPDNETARLTLAVGNTADDEELGAFLLKRMIGFSQQRGIGILSGDAARSNARLLTLGDKLGFTQSDVPGEPDVVRIILKQR